MAVQVRIDQELQLAIATELLDALDSAHRIDMGQRRTRMSVTPNELDMIPADLLFLLYRVVFLDPRSAVENLETLAAETVLSLPPGVVRKARSWVRAAKERNGESTEPGEYEQLLANTCSPDEARRRTDSAEQKLMAMGITKPQVKVNRLEVIDHTPSGTGRDYVKGPHKQLFRVDMQVQDNGRSLKLFLTEVEE